MNKLKDKLKMVKDKSVNKYRGLKAKTFIAMTTMACTMSNASNVYAAGSNTSSIDKLIDYVADWVFKIGGIVAFVGGIMFIIGFVREDSDGKIRGLFTAAAGFMLMGLTGALDIFGL